jgi:SAM-dependent methyltransferase
LEELYHHYYDRALFDVDPASAASLERLAASFEPFRRSGRWIDLGYGEGGLLAAAEKLAWSCYGTEISPQALHYGTQRGWIVSSDADQDPRFPPEGFDVVTMIEFLEHVHDPQAYLSAALQWLRPGGLLYLTTPNANSLNRLLLGLDWSIFKPPEHVTIWTTCGLRTALLRAGFLCNRIRTEGFNPCEVLARLCRELPHLRRAVSESDVAPVDRNQSAFALNRALSSSPLRRAIKRGINDCLNAFRIGDSLKAWAVKAQ